MRITQAIILFLVATVTMSALPDKSSGKPERIEITVKRFSYEPSEITVHKGQPVTFVLTSADVTHGLAVKELGIKTELKKGKPVETSFTPETVGTFTGKCSYFCGMGHGSMKLTIHVIE